MSESRLHLQLLPAGHALPTGLRPIKTKAPFQAGLRLHDGKVETTFILPELSRSEVRWGLGNVLSNLRKTFDLGAVELRADPGVDDNTVMTLALDQHMSTQGRATLFDREHLTGDLERHQAALDVYRGWVNEDPLERTSLAIERDVRAWAEGREDIALEILDESALAERKMRLLLAVGSASKVSPPRLIIARYKPNDPRPPRMFLGKGITFDTGGINVKPYESFVSMMRNDMAGSALAWSLFQALVEDGIDEPLLLVIPSCENPIGEDTMRPGSIVKSYRGINVRIDHTDAEGRLILADGLAYATDCYHPSQVVCFATLTTAALISYGPYATPVHFADPETKKRLENASDAMGEDLHFFPHRIWHMEANADEEADLKNTAGLPQHAKRSAGSRNAAHFLKHFTDVPLVHLDIFASTWNWAGDAPGAGPGATGAPLRTLLSAYGGR